MMCEACGDVIRTAVYDVGALHVDWPERVVKWRGKRVVLTPSQVEMMDMLARSADRTVAYGKIAEACISDETSDRVAYVHMAHIRKAFRAIDRNFAQIETNRAIGYKWRREVAA